MLVVCNPSLTKALIEHSVRVHCYGIEWKLRTHLRGGLDLLPCNWVWQLASGIIILQTRANSSEQLQLVPRNLDLETFYSF